MLSGESVGLGVELGADLGIVAHLAVTAGGCELITRGVPVKADEIEALMRG